MSRGHPSATDEVRHRGQDPEQSRYQRSSTAPLFQALGAVFGTPASRIGRGSPSDRASGANAPPRALHVGGSSAPEAGLARAGTAGLFPGTRGAFSRPGPEPKARKSCALRPDRVRPTALFAAPGASKCRRAKGGEFPLDGDSPERQGGVADEATRGASSRRRVRKPATRKAVSAPATIRSHRTTLELPNPYECIPDVRTKFTPT